MASFNKNEDLMKLKGAMLVSVNHPMAGGKPVSGVFIPCDWNDIQVRESRQQAGQYSATLRTVMWPAREEYIQKIRENRQQRGEDITTWQPPSHTIEVNYSEEFMARARAAAKKRILAEHPEWQGYEDESLNTDLRKLITAAVRTNIGTAYAIIPKADRQQAPVQAQAAQGVQQWTPGAEPFPPQDQPDDLPF